ncbi:type VI secretion system-associated protein VasI [Aeromonas hydrophila]|uniref:type VI secretion system-associated protein VasI n=1 Tax=Aeromonas hydrophila TaxID=644 RepID=UPI0005D9871D|nr:type VI secretion system-associated protein VasI [Aeromonas hydrophila]AKA17731.1 type VI secretion protein [Aeromonas hydrophila]HAT2247654.1 type VI secretion system-associated protein TagO [Aeromonas hydrophila]HAT2381293.1 type VI secretion system-associated protein TagO [Aeromonas hydrophila]HAT2415043.1 type VI secretion system-associated protein TagO [Aeromonas hydrophila]HAT2526996.1 type VI secretion system-associated protein TagO [Aeromonas hydrophila]
MSILGLLPLLLATNAAEVPLDMARWQACRQEPSPLVRLACYDAIGNGAASAAEGVAPKSAAWQAIWAQEQVRTPESAPFLLQSDAGSGSETLTRPALRGATLAIGCVDSITHIRLRLDSPWSGEKVQVELDGQPSAGSQSWFIRDQGLLLEYGRGLPAIEELKRWQGHRELQVRADNGALLRVDLSGLKEALAPLRQQCRW